MKGKTLSLIDVIVGLSDPNDSTLPKLLPVADREVTNLLDAGITDEAVEKYTTKVAHSGIDGYTARCGQLDALLQSEGHVEVSDTADGVIIETRDAAFALGLALGIRIGGAR